MSETQRPRHSTSWQPSRSATRQVAYSRPSTWISNIHIENVRPCRRATRPNHWALVAEDPPSGRFAIVFAELYWAVNAYHNPTQNEIVFPAAITPAPRSSTPADDAVNFSTNQRTVSTTRSVTASTTPELATTGGKPVELVNGRGPRCAETLLLLIAQYDASPQSSSWALGSSRRTREPRAGVSHPTSTVRSRSARASATPEDFHGIAVGLGGVARRAGRPPDRSHHHRRNLGSAAFPALGDFATTQLCGRTPQFARQMLAIDPPLPDSDAIRLKRDTRCQKDSTSTALAGTAARLPRQRVTIW